MPVIGAEIEPGCRRGDDFTHGLYPSHLSFSPSPHRGEGGERSEPGEVCSEFRSKFREPLTPTLSPAGRGSAGAVLTLSARERHALDLAAVAETELHRPGGA